MELAIADLKPFLPGLKEALDDEVVSEVMINVPALTTEAVERAAVQIARPLGKDPLAEPIIDAHVAICGPLAAPSTAITFRRFGGRAFTVDDLTASGSLPAAVVDQTATVLRSRRNVLISGGTGSGKLTLLNALVSSLPAEGRVVSIKDPLELRLEAHGLAVRDATIRHLVRHALRHRLDHIVVGEVRGTEGGGRLAPSPQHRPRRQPGHHACERRRGGAVATGDRRHAGKRCAPVGRCLPAGLSTASRRSFTTRGPGARRTGSTRWSASGTTMRRRIADAWTRSGRRPHRRRRRGRRCPASLHQDGGNKGGDVQHAKRRI